MGWGSAYPSTRRAAQVRAATTPILVPPHSYSHCIHIPAAAVQWHSSNGGAQHALTGAMHRTQFIAILADMSVMTLLSAVSAPPHQRHPAIRRLRWVATALAASILFTACEPNATDVTKSDKPQPLPAASPTPTLPPQPVNSLPGMPPVLDVANIYAGAGQGKLSPAVANHRELIYVPHTVTDEVWVIDPTTFSVIDKFPAGDEPQHVVPAYDLSVLYATADEVPGGSLTPIDPTTGKPGAPIAVQDPYNLYFTPDGKFAVVVAEYYQRLDFYDPKTWERKNSVTFPECEGINHMDFSADGTIALATCEFANRMVVIDVANQAHLRTFELSRGHGDHGGPQDVRLSPDGSVFYVADMHANGVYVFDSHGTRELEFIPTGLGTHAVYFSRDAARAFITNRGDGTITVLDTKTRQITATWTVPNGSPDMGGVSADGSLFWLSGRYHGEVYAINTTDGSVVARIPVGAGPHGLLVWPQPGRYSLGHTGNMR